MFCTLLWNSLGASFRAPMFAVAGAALCTLLLSPAPLARAQDIVAPLEQESSSAIVVAEKAAAPLPSFAPAAEPELISAPEPQPGALGYSDGPRGGYIERTFNYRMAAVVVWSATVQQLFNETAYWGQGLSGYGKRLGVAASANIAKSYATIAVGRALHQDPDYRRCACSGIGHRIGYILHSELHDHEVSGRAMFPVARFAGYVAYTAVDLAPRNGQRNLANAGIDLGLQIGGALGRRFLAEFWPDVRRARLRSSGK